jgi:hypothetical protein
MKLAEIITEMAKSATKRKREAKRSRKNKAENPTPDKQSNPVAKFAQTSGAGKHRDKKKYTRKEKFSHDY